MLWKWQLSLWNRNPMIIFALLVSNTGVPSVAEPIIKRVRMKRNLREHFVIKIIPIVCLYRNSLSWWSKIFSTPRQWGELQPLAAATTLRFGSDWIAGSDTDSCNDMWLLTPVLSLSQQILSPAAPPVWAAAGGPTLFLISAAMVMKACSTLVAFLAEVSKKGMPSWSAYSLAEV